MIASDKTSGTFRASETSRSGPPASLDESENRFNFVQESVVAGLAILATLLRVWVAKHIYVVNNDAAGGYLYQAREILRGDWQQGLGMYFPPGYPLAISGA